MPPVALQQVDGLLRIFGLRKMELREFLLQTPDLIRKGGRLCLISYHSLEDRLVKRFIRNGMFEGEPEKDLYGNFYVPFKKIGKLQVPTPEEVMSNNRARSAKLRIAERV